MWLVTVIIADKFTEGWLWQVTTWWKNDGELSPQYVLDNENRVFKGKIISHNNMNNHMQTMNVQRTNKRQLFITMDSDVTQIMSRQKIMWIRRQMNLMFTWDVHVAWDVVFWEWMLVQRCNAYVSSPMLHEHWCICQFKDEIIWDDIWKIVYDSSPYDDES